MGVEKTVAQLVHSDHARKGDIGDVYPVKSVDFYTLYTEFGTYARMITDTPFYFGSLDEYWIIYEGSGLQIWSSDIDGGGTDGLIANCGDGTDDWEFNGILTMAGLVVTGQGTIEDDIVLDFGDAHDAKMMYGTVDANANILLIALPNGGAVNVPIFAIGDQSVHGVDLGFFDGETIPRFAAIADDASGFFAFGCDNADILDILATTSPVVEADETKFSHKLQCVINGNTYYIMLTQT